MTTANEISTEYNGGIGVETKEGRDNTFEILLPACSESTENKFKFINVEDIPGGNETVLIVDDEKVIRRMFERILGKYGYTVYTAENGKDAVEIYHHQQEDIDLVVMDMIMPVMDGRTALMEMKKIDPDVKTILISAQIPINGTEQYRKDGFCGFIVKPFMAETILFTVRDTLDKLNN